MIGVLIMGAIFVSTEASIFCLLTITFLWVFKTKILSKLVSEEKIAYSFSLLGILISIISGFTTKATIQTICFVVCGFCFALALACLIKGKTVTSVLTFIVAAVATYFSLNYGLNIAVYGVTFAIIIRFAVEQYNKIRVDNLTKLYNRYGMDVELKEQLTQYKRDKNDSFYIIACDLDKFKQINDTWGHLEGDRALKLVADALSRVSKKFRSNVFRIGGDEFVIITDTSEEGLAIDITNAIKKEFDNMDFREDWDIKISLGTALYDGKSTIDELFNSADKKLYEAKRS